MYEDQTYEVILERMLNRVSDKLDKRPSSLIYLSLIHISEPTRRS